MLPIYLNAINFKSYVNERLDFTKLGSIFSIAGVNGAGKSSIIDMITVALFNRNEVTDARGTGGEHLINRDADFFQVEYGFEIDGIDYVVIRKRTKDGKHELKLTVNGTDVSEKLNETQAKIKSIIGMDYDTFMDTVCIGQGVANRFMLKNSKERKAIFNDVLGLGKYELLEKLARSKRKDVKEQMDSVELKIKMLNFDEIKLAELGDEIKTNKISLTKVEGDLEAARNKVTLINDKLTELNKAALETQRIIIKRNNLINQINDVTNQITLYESWIDNLNSGLNGNKNYQQLISDIDDEINKNNELISELNAKLGDLNNLIAVNKNKGKEFKGKYTRLQDYGDSVCELCGNLITPEHKQQHLNELMTNGKKALKQIKDDSIKVDEINDKIQDLKSILNGLNRDRQALITDEALEKKNVKQLNEYKAQKSQLNDTLIQLKSELTENKKTSVKQVDDEAIKQLNSELNTEQNTINQLTNQLITLKSNDKILNDELLRLIKAEKMITNYNKQVDVLSESLSDYDSLIKAFGKDGIPADVIDYDLPELESAINDVLQVVSDNSISVNFATQKEKGKGKRITTVETLDVIVNDLTGSRNYETYSGGERFKVDFAFHVGFSRFLAKREGTNANFFIIDEGLGSQDDNARIQFVNTVKKLCVLFDKIMVITHIDSVHEAFDNRVSIVKDPINGSKLII